VEGVDRFKDILRQTHHSFPDLQITLDRMVAEGERVVVWWTYVGTHQREVLFGVEPSGKRVKVSGITEYRIINGQVIEERGIVDNLGLMMQLQEG
jgi:predicted ester cyclase